MNSVIKHILARKNKSVPVKDGRKIALVLFGGTMSGVRGGATVCALQELGLSNAFDVIYSISAGFANASYFLAENACVGTSIYYEDFLGKEFINPFRFWKILDNEHAVNVMKKKKILDVKKVIESKTKLYLSLRNVKDKKINFFKINNIKKSQYFKYFRAATSIAFLNPGDVKIGNGEYKDNFSWEDYSTVVSQAYKDGATDVLVVYNYYIPPRTLKILHPKKTYEIMPKKGWVMSKYEQDPEKLIETAEQMGNYVKKIFGSKKKIKLCHSPEL